MFNFSTLLCLGEGRRDRRERERWKRKKRKEFDMGSSNKVK
jgi:hypothetical protein